jgi:hypothetical protein
MNIFFQLQAQDHHIVWDALLVQCVQVRLHACRPGDYSINSDRVD